MYFKKGIIAVLLFMLCGAERVSAEEIFEWQKCVMEAEHNHPDLIAAKEKLVQSIETKNVTRSGLLPQISSNVSESTANNTSSSGGDANYRYPTTFSYGVSGEQLLFDGFKTVYDVRTAEENIKSAQYNYEVVSSNIRLSLRTAFSDLLSAQELLNVTESIAARRKQNMELVKLRYEGGREHRGSYMTAEADLAEANFEVEQAKRAIYVAQRLLSKELGRSKMPEPLEAQGDFSVKENCAAMPDFENMADTNPLLKQLVAKKEAAKYGVKSAKAEFFPTVYANAGSGNSYSVSPPGKEEWSFGTSVSFPLFEGGKRLADVAKAKAVYNQTQADELSGRNGVIYTLAKTWSALANAVEKVNVQKKYLEAATERAKIAEAEYSTGLLTFDNWIIIEDNLVSAKKNYLAAEQAALLAEANWIQAKGGTLDYDKKQ
ncbi:MAG TPA: TolC family protein [Candidatus Omnitrophota bacterium]|nr:TolC family protein [Candidatus Omnitrophota bacterium]HPS20978.1 TolC family protein [Candidatus Omnitrophota bacterium]